MSLSLSIIAYEVLSDSKKRKEYDMNGSNGGGFHFNGGKAQDFHFNFDELFK